MMEINIVICSDMPANELLMVTHPENLVSDQGIKAVYKAIVKKFPARDVASIVKTKFVPNLVGCYGYDPLTEDRTDLIEIRVPDISKSDLLSCIETLKADIRSWKRNRVRVMSGYVTSFGSKET